MMTEPASGWLSARRRRIQSGPDLQPGQETRFVLFGETMIRHAVLSGTITAISVGVHGATTRSCLIASPSFPLSVAAGFLRAGSDAVDLASITLPTDKNLRVAASAQKHPARSFIDTCGSAGPTCRALRLCQVRQYSVLRPRVCSLPRFWLRRPSPLNLSRARRAPACGYVDNVRALLTYPTPNFDTIKDKSI